MPGRRTAELRPVWRHEMTRLSRVACLGLILACGDSTPRQLSGRWIGNRFESLDGEVSAARAGWARGTSLSFSGSRLSVSVPGEPPRDGDYRVLSNEDGVIALAVIGHDGHEDLTHLTLETEKLLRWHLDEVHTVVMRRR